MKDQMTHAEAISVICEKQEHIESLQAEVAEANKEEIRYKMECRSLEKKLSISSQKVESQAAEIEALHLELDVCHKRMDDMIAELEQLRKAQGAPVAWINKHMLSAMTSRDGYMSGHGKQYLANSMRTSEDEVPLYRHPTIEHTCKFKKAIDLKTMDSWQECSCGKRMKAGYPYDRPQPVTERSVPEIDYDADMDRYYIPVHANWEIQTKGKGSSFRLANRHTDERWMVTDKYLQTALEQMARDINAAPKGEEG